MLFALLYYCSLHILDDLWDFLTKSLFVAFNFWEPENSPFHVFDVSGPSGYQMNWGKCTVIIFLGERSWEKEPEERSHEGRMGMAHMAKESVRVGPTHSLLGPHFDLPF
jgi:hypothetical protein